MDRILRPKWINELNAAICRPALGRELGLAFGRLAPNSAVQPRVAESLNQTLWGEPARQLRAESGPSTPIMVMSQSVGMVHLDDRILGDSIPIAHM